MEENSIPVLDSILNSTKKFLGIQPEDSSFNNDLIPLINTAISVAMQIGIGKDPTFAISGEDEVWSDFVDDFSNIEMLKTYIGLQTKLLFDPPSHAAGIEVINKHIQMLEFRLNIQVDTGENSAWRNDSTEDRNG